MSILLHSRRKKSTFVPGMNNKKYLLDLIRDDGIRHLLSIMRGRQTLNQIVSLSRLPRYKVIGLLARLIRFNTIRWEYDAQKFLFSMV